MADINLNPPKKGNLHSRTGVAYETGIKFGMLVKTANTTTAAEVVKSAAAADVGIMGVVTSIGDPNNSDAFAVGDEFSVRDLGDVELLVLAAGATYAETDVLIPSATAGVAKKVESETGVMQVVGYPLQKITTGAGATQRISCRLALQTVKL